MAILTIEIDTHQEERLRRLAMKEAKTAEELCLEALDRLLADHPDLQHPPGRDRYGAFREMIGLAKDGPTDSSLQHDYRPGDDA